jgi:nicotinamidase-related amidase
MDVKILNKTKFIEAMKEQLRINPKTAALVVVDMHQGHLDPDIAISLVPESERKRVLTNAKRLIEIVRNYRIPIIHVIVNLRPVERNRRINPFMAYAQRVNSTLEPEERSWVGKLGNTEGWWKPEIMAEVAPKPEDYVINNKKTYSIYLGTDLEMLLKTLGVDTVVLIGINTNTCDLCSSYETVNRGFKLIVISDCVASAYGQDLHLFALQNIARCLGWVLTIPEFEEKLKTGP